jgi:hypothetical protein
MESFAAMTAMFESNQVQYLAMKAAMDKAVGE